jgi:hypothetical protein
MTEHLSDAALWEIIRQPLAQDVDTRLHDCCVGQRRWWLSRNAGISCQKMSRGRQHSMSETPEQDSDYWKAQAALWQGRYERLLADIETELKYDSERQMMSNLLLSALASIYKREKLTGRGKL